MPKIQFPRVDFSKYSRPKYLLACYTEWGVGWFFRGIRQKRERCPFCSRPNSKDRCFSWSFSTCRFYCHRCRQKGDAIEMVQLMTGKKIMDAAKWLEEKAGPAGSGLVGSGEHA